MVEVESNNGNIFIIKKLPKAKDVKVGISLTLEEAEALLEVLPEFISEVKEYKRVFGTLKEWGVVK